MRTTSAVSKTVTQGKMPNESSFVAREEIDLFTAKIRASRRPEFGRELVSIPAIPIQSGIVGYSTRAKAASTFAEATSGSNT